MNKLKCKIILLSKYLVVSKFNLLVNKKKNVRLNKIPQKATFHQLMFS